MPHVEQPQTILIVEDEANIASFVKLYLEKAGYAVRRAATAARAPHVASGSRR